ncbi:DUF6191 domain-containing protein [Streptomyces roseolus]|uniref:DUF6191 domain-containing protein n=1 Tax=Streptomyces roseolus TaxID=67358 RepID=UPI003648D30E
MGASGGLDAFFAPGRRHAEEERRRLAPPREDPGAAVPGPGPVDLAPGRVAMRLPGPDAASAGGGEEVEAVGEGGGLAPAGDAQLGEDVGDVDARRLG